MSTNHFELFNLNTTKVLSITLDVKLNSQLRPTHQTMVDDSNVNLICHRIMSRSGFSYHETKVKIKTINSVSNSLGYH